MWYKLHSIIFFVPDDENVPDEKLPYNIIADDVLFRPGAPGWIITITDTMCL